MPGGDVFVGFAGRFSLVVLLFSITLGSLFASPKDPMLLTESWRSI